MSTIDFGFPGHFGKIYDMNLYVGTIVSVAGNIASVNIKGTVYDNVEICYNCEDGSSVNGGSAFLPDDEVYILNKGGKTPLWVPNLIIVGFTNGKHACEEVFYIKLTRGDGTIIDSSLLNYIYVYTSAKSWVNREVTYITNPSDPRYQYWKIKIISPIDVNGYYIRYDAEDSITTQYPYRYKSADWFNSIDLIKPGVYEDTVPYWVVTEENTLTPLFALDEIAYLKKTIKSSVPYKITKKTVRVSNAVGGVYNTTSTWESSPPHPSWPNFYDYTNNWYIHPETYVTYISVYDGEELDTHKKSARDEEPYYEVIAKTYNINLPSISGIDHFIYYKNMTPETNLLYYYGPGGFEVSLIGTLSLTATTIIFINPSHPEYGYLSERIDHELL